MTEATERLVFKRSEPFRLGVEIELQIVNTRDFNLSRGAPDLLRLTGKQRHAGEIKPEITESMVEMATSIHSSHDSLLRELLEMRDLLVRGADRLNLAICGGGSHPFQKWSEQRIFARPRFAHLSDLYGYLAKQFTVFGQHIHVGCGNGDDAIHLLHGFSRYIPHFIVLSASSPFFQGHDTSFVSSRLNAIAAFPLSGYMPFVSSWDEFNDYFRTMQDLGIVESMKDFYWDIRPKPEFGSVEMRVCDTPLTVEQAAGLAAYAQALARSILAEPRTAARPDSYFVYTYNRFQACRFGFDGLLVDPQTRQHRTLRDDILETLAGLEAKAAEFGSSQALGELARQAESRQNGSAWLRDAMARAGSLHDVVRLQAELWAGRLESDE